MKTPPICLFLYIALFLAPCALWADVFLAPLFRDGAVLQQGKAVSVWGHAAPGEKVVVKFAAQKKETTADNSGKWSIILDPLSASSVPEEMTVTGNTTTVTVSDILVGEVWICSGQSNMAWSVKNVKDAEKEIAAAAYPLIRHFKTALSVSDAPKDVVNGEWTICSPQTVGDFSASGYFFVRELHKELGVPIGLINASYGGTPIEAWMSAEALRSTPVFAPIFERWKQTVADYPAQMKLYEGQLNEWKADRAAGRESSRRPPRKPDGPGGRMEPSGLFNAMVHPHIPYGIRGIIWYQGENNAPRFSEYSALFQTMITQWRRDFGQGDVPFYFVQLANFNRKSDLTGQQWAFQREAQATAFKLPNTGMAVAADIGEAGNIHPANKQEVGRRLALNALALTYGKAGEYAGPIFQQATSEGNAMRVQFDHADGLSLAGGEGGSFELAGSDRVFHSATAKVEKETLVVVSPFVQAPVAIRYGWKNNPTMTVYNSANLPAAPFRSDDWPAPLASAVDEETQ